MKRTIWIIALAALGLGHALQGQNITVISPAAGSEWPVGSTRTISWTSSGVNGPLSIKLRLADQPHAAPVLEIAASTANDGSFTWAIPVSMPAGDYEVRVRTVSDDPLFFGDSGNFKLTVKIPGQGPPPPMLKVESPNGGESWRLNTEHVIQWSSHFLSGKVMLQLYHAAGAPAGLIAADQPSSGSLVWKAGKISSGYVGEGQYKVRVVAKNDYHINDISDQPFTLKPSLAELIKPDGPLPHRPDLVVCAEASVSVPLNTPGTFHVSVRNIGSGTAKAPFKVTFSIVANCSQSAMISSDLAPGETRLVGECSGQGVAVVDYKFIAIADADGQIEESHENNNRIERWLHCRLSEPAASGPITCSDGSPL